MTERDLGMVADEVLQVAHVMNGMPSQQGLADLYIKYGFNRRKVADHLGITPGRLSTIQKHYFGKTKLPRPDNYNTLIQEIRWHKQSFPAWTIPDLVPYKQGSNDGG